MAIRTVLNSKYIFNVSTWEICRERQGLYMSCSTLSYCEKKHSRIRTSIALIMEKSLLNIKVSHISLCSTCPWLGTYTQRPLWLKTKAISSTSSDLKRCLSSGSSWVLQFCFDETAKKLSKIVFRQYLATILFRHRQQEGSHSQGIIMNELFVQR